jgi:alkylation response protein AidB-like acyl-CoA dehydrogenase
LAAAQELPMDLNLLPEEEEYRQKVRAWLAENLPKVIAERRAGKISGIEWSKKWQRMLYEAGYVALAWPKQYGGQELDPMRQFIVNDELARGRAPGVIGAQAINLLGPTLITFGTEEQRRRYLPKMLRAEEIWCQGYSEPGAGSDLASLRTRAEVKGDHFVVNGQKVWTSRSRYADRMFALVRTDPAAPKHRGISYLLIDMKTPGITVRPLVQMTGDRGFSEVFFDNVQVPRENLVGQLNDGWRVANDTLYNERNLGGAVEGNKQVFNRLVELARNIKRGGAALIKNPVYRQRLIDFQITVEAMRLHGLRQLTDQIHKRPRGAESLVNKLVGSELTYEMTKMALEMEGDYAPLLKGDERAPDRGYWPTNLMAAMGLMIGGGTSQIQKNIIAQRGLKMPKGPE